MEQRTSTTRRKTALVAAETSGTDLAWSLLLTIRNRGRRAGTFPMAFALGGARITIEADGRWMAQGPIGDPTARMLDLYLPMALSGAERPLVVGHLGVSLDGHVATETGESQYITGRENIVHLHRLRALADAVIVGATTVEHDDPRLTTRHVEGDNPVRVVIDPSCRLGRAFQVFSDGAAETLLVCAEDRAGTREGRHGRARVIGIPFSRNGLSLDALLDRLRSLGLHGILVEGGGVTVSRFLEQGKLDRLHLAVAPLITGAGRPGLSLAPICDLGAALRPRCRHFAMGPDVLFDCDLRADGAS